MTTHTLDYRFAYCQARKAESEALRRKLEAERNIYGTTDYNNHLTERERQIYQQLGYLDPRLADEDAARKYQPQCTPARSEKIAPRLAEDYKRKGG